MRSLALAAAALLTLAAPAAAQTSTDWREVAPENLLVIDTSKGRILVELDPTAAPRHVERIRTLASQGFYDGLLWHRVIANFMAQTGDPEGTGAGGSPLPDIAAEFSFRRGRDPLFAAVPTAANGVFGLHGSLPVQTQPDAQMMVTADFKVGAGGLFCPGVLGMARSGSPDSANSQFFLMSGRNASLDGQYTAFGRVVSGLVVVRSLKTGSNAEDGRVTDPDRMTRARLASDLPDGERARVRVAAPGSAGLTAAIEAARTRAGTRFTVCDVDLPVEVTS
jgi:cyclophilin family peptidyl-prolyl cis-trans isomerase